MELIYMSFSLESEMSTEKIILDVLIFIGYWLDMEIYVRVLVRSNIARRQERNINYAPERVHIFPYPTNNLFITYALLTQNAL